MSKKIKFSEGDIFQIPSTVDGFYLGQIAKDTSRDEIGVPFVYIYGDDVHKENLIDSEFNSSNIVSASFVTHELIAGGKWRVIRNLPVPYHEALNEVERLKKIGFVGARIIGGGLVAKYLDTFYGLLNKDIWPDITYVNRFFNAKSGSRMPV